MCQVSPVSFEHYVLYNNFIVYCIMLNAIPLKQTDVSSGFVSERRIEDASLRCILQQVGCNTLMPPLHWSVFIIPVQIFVHTK